MTKAFARQSPRGAEEENDVQALLGGLMLVNLHICPCLSQMRGLSGSKASTWQAERRLGCIQWQAAASPCCLVVSTKLVGKIQAGNGEYRQK